MSTTDAVSLPVGSGARPSSPSRSGRRMPLIGIPISREDAHWGVWRQPADLLNAAYSTHIRMAGGLPLLLPVGGSQEEAVEATTVLDGLLLAGGPDVDPARYNEPAHGSAGPFHSERDEWELALFRAASGAAVPVLGICRGLQIMTVALGGTLIQHLPDVVGTTVHNPTVGQFGSHEITTKPGSKINGLIGERLQVPTYHHQAVDDLGPTWQATAWALDGTVEAVESCDGAWLVGVQWHPEMSQSTVLFDGFIDAVGLRGHVDGNQANGVIDGRRSSAGPSEKEPT